MELVKVIATDKAQFHKAGEEYEMYSHHAERMIAAGTAVLPGAKVEKPAPVVAKEPKAEVPKQDVKPTTKTSKPHTK